jgi:hypothetical protein
MEGNLNTISNHEGNEDKAGTFNSNDNLQQGNESHENQEKEVAFAIDYEISPENTKRFELYKNEDVEEAIEVFCKDNSLSPEQKDAFKALVHSKISSS